VQAALDNLDRTGVFIDAVKLWRLRPEIDRTYNNICWEHFTLADLKRQRELTAKSAGYHGTALAATGKTPPHVPTNAAASSNTPTTKYCWTHGCGVNAMGHTSAKCTHQATGHNPDATINNTMLGGNMTICRQKGEQPIYKPRGRAAAAVVAPSDPPAPVETTPPIST
jgi:hypothetical protein